MPRTRPHFKAHTSIKHHRKMARIYADNDLLALWMRLGIVAVERFASKTGDEFRIHQSELTTLGGGKRRDKVEVSLRLLAGYLDLTLRLDEGYFVIQWPNFSRKQGFNTKNGTPQSTESRVQRADSVGDTSRPPGSAPKRAKKKARRVTPHREAPRLAALLREHITTRHGGWIKQGEPDLDTWERDMDRLLRIDKVDPSKVEAVMHWAVFDSTFWGGVIQSPRGLRNNWDKVAAQYVQSRPREMFGASKAVLEASEGGRPNGAGRESVATRLLGAELGGIRTEG